MAAAKYAHEDSAGSERPLKVCAEAGRKCVRNIQQYPILSVEWIALVDHLRQLSRLVQLEGRMPANTKVGEAQGRNVESGGTLWDQEGHENAIRILVEEAKVNLCLRMMSDYKRWAYDLPARDASMRQAMAASEYHESQLEQKCAQYEECLGMLLARAFEHVETLQLMGIPLLIEHCCLVLEHVSKGSELQDTNLQVQEFVVLQYFSSLMKHSEALNNSELLAKAKEFRLLRLVTDHIQLYSDSYPSDLTLALCEGLSAMADNEDFSTDWEQFFETQAGEPDTEAKLAFLDVEDKLAKKVLEVFPDRKKDIRPLLDLFGKIRKTVR